MPDDPAAGQGRRGQRVGAGCVGRRGESPVAGRAAGRLRPTGQGVGSLPGDDVAQRVLTAEACAHRRNQLAVGRAVNPGQEGLGALPLAGDEPLGGIPEGLAELVADVAGHVGHLVANLLVGLEEALLVIVENVHQEQDPEPGCPDGGGLERQVVLGRHGWWYPLRLRWAWPARTNVDHTRIMLAQCNYSCTLRNIVGGAAILLPAWVCGSARKHITQKSGERAMTLKADDRVPVLIAGGSLVGLSAALFLARLGIGHLLVERHAQTSHHPRGRGNNLRTMELFRTARVEPRIVEAASLLAGNHGILQVETMTSGDGEWLIREVNPGGEHARISPSNWCLCSQNDLEPVLLRAARDLGGNIRFATELVSFQQDGEGVTALVRSRETGDERTVRADYLIAAD